MEFGFSRFLEMFEERFGRTVTTAVLGLVGTAVVAYCTKVIVDEGIHIYELIKSADLLTALEQESAGSHVVVFLVQITITFIVLSFIWRWFYNREMKKIESDFDETEAKLEGMIKTIEKSIEDFEGKVKALEQRESHLIGRMDQIRARQEEILASSKKTDQASG